MGLKRMFAGTAAVGVMGTFFLQCSSSSPAARPGETFQTGGNGGSGAGGVPVGAGGTPAIGGAGSLGTGPIINPAKPEPVTDGGRPPRSDDEGHCSCINVGSLGRPGSYGVNGKGSDDSELFQRWLNSNSSASFKLITNKPTLTKSFLDDFDVIVLQALDDAEMGPFWHFSDEEVRAFTEWVNAGGGVITMAGYGGNSAEVTGVNQLRQFTGISYNTDDIFQAKDCPVPPPTNCYCWGNSIPVTGWQPGSPVSKNITSVGGFYARSINAPKDAEVIATNGTLNYAVGKQVGKGKVFVFADEWVTYTSQWLSTAVMKVTDMNAVCYGKSADIKFQVPQFWYNVIKWVNPTQCVFTIDDPAIIQ